MNCESCGGVVAEEAAFCPHCGAQVADRGEDSAGPTAQPQAAAAQRLKPGSRGNTDPVNEQELWSGTYSAKAMLGPAVGLAILTIVALIAGSFAPPAGWMIAAAAAVVAWVIFGMMLLYRRMSVAYRLTNYRLFHETGILSRTRDRIEVIDIDDVRLQQGPIERFLDLGTISILSSDITHGDLKLAGIEDVRRVADLIDNTRRAERQRRGLFMENV